MGNAKRDENNVPVILGTSSTDNVTPIPVQVNPVTGRMKVDVTGVGTSPLTTKGDVYTYDTDDARLPVGTNGQVLSADSVETTGLKWIDPDSGHTIQEEGSDLTQRTNLNFIGGGVTATDNSGNDATDVTLNSPASDPSGVTGADAVTNIISLTQAQYDAIGTPDASTIYNITDASGGGISEFFSVFRDSDSGTGAGVDTLLTWATALVNDNSNFDLGNDEFVAPSDGDYIFDLSVYTESNEQSTILGLYDGSNVLYTGQSVTTGTSLGIVHRVFTKLTLTTGDKVRGRVTFAGANVLSATTNFSGYKIS